MVISALFRSFDLYFQPEDCFSRNSFSKLHL